MPVKLSIDDEQIALGKSLKRLKENEDFQIFIKEINQRIMSFDVRIKQFSRRSQTPDNVMSNLDRLQELTDLLEWLDDEIDRGGRAIMRKQEANK